MYPDLRYENLSQTTDGARSCTATLTQREWWLYLFTLYKFGQCMYRHIRILSVNQQWGQKN